MRTTEAPTPLDRVLDRLRAMRFEVDERAELFGEPLPHLKAIATDTWARQLVLVAEDPREPEVEGREVDAPEDGWQDLLFAVSGLRHHLRGAGPPALGSPVLLALADDAGVAALRDLVERIAREYALFSRLDINIVNRGSAMSDENLDSALTSLLPRVRRAIQDEVTVAPQDVDRFWVELSGEIERAAGGLSGDFQAGTIEGSIGRIGQELNSRPRAAGGEVPPPVAPISTLRVESFRSFEMEEVEIPAVGIVYGSNGTGKTSLSEAMEILWSGRTQRIPEGIKALEYEKHLNRSGRQFRLSCAFAGGAGEGERSQIGDDPEVPLGRTVLPQHSVGEMAGSSPQARFRAFLTASGLELPDFEERVIEVRREAHREANAALAQAGIDEGIRAVNANGLNHLRAKLQAGFAAELPQRAELEGAAEALVEVSEGAYQGKPLGPNADEQLRLAVDKADAALNEVHDKLDQAPDPTPAVEAAVEALNRESDRLVASSAPLRQLLDHLRSLEPVREAKVEVPPASPTPVPPQEAARWLSQVRGVERSILALKRSLGEIEDEEWRDRLRTYIEALSAAVEISSVEKLEKMIAAAEPPPAAQRRPLSPPPMALLGAAGFTREPNSSEAMLAALEDLHERQTAHSAALSRVASELLRHPGPSFSARSARIMPALCNFELAREVAKPTGAVTRARETLVGRLLDDRLKPVVQELVAALVRFEWYFADPLEMAVKKRSMQISGLSSSDPNLDIRMLLNEAEKTVVGIAWFLALHTLQSKPDREVLVLDDPASGFDETNKAAFVATLRSLLRMLEPKQVLVTTHDDAVVALLEQELGQVAGWPAEVGILRCSRSADGASKVVREDPAGPREADIERELRMLSLSIDEVSAAQGEQR